MRNLKSILTAIVLLFIVSTSLFSQKNSLSVMGNSYILMNSISCLYERNIRHEETFDIHLVVFVGNVVYNGLSYSDKGINIDGGIGGLGYTMIKKYREKSKYEVGAKILRLNSGDVKKTFFPSFHFGLRSRYRNVLIRTGYEFIGGLYLSAGYVF